MASTSSWFSQDYFKGFLILELLITNDLRRNWIWFLTSILSAQLICQPDFHFRRTWPESNLRTVRLFAGHDDRLTTWFLLEDERMSRTR